MIIWNKTKLKEILEQRNTCVWEYNLQPRSVHSGFWTWHSTELFRTLLLCVSCTLHVSQQHFSHDDCSKRGKSNLTREPPSVMELRHDISTRWSFIFVSSFNHTHTCPPFAVAQVISKAMQSYKSTAEDGKTETNERGVKTAVSLSVRPCASPALTSNVTTRNETQCQSIIVLLLLKSFVVFRSISQ